MTKIARICVLTVLTLTGVQASTPLALADCDVCYDCPGTAIRVPLTKWYQIQPGYCPQQLVAMIQRCVPIEGCGPSCGPYGIPPIYVAGNSVLVRQMPEVQERVAKYLTELGAYIPRKYSQASLRTNE